MTFDVREETFLAEAAARLEHIPGVRTAFVGGSLVDGFGNSASDVDLIVLTEEEVTAAQVRPGRGEDFVEQSDHGIWVSRIRDRRLDVEFRKGADLDSARDVLSGGGGRPDFDRFVLELFHHLRIGIPVVAPESFERTRDSFPWTALSAHLVGHFEFAANSALDDASGAIDAKDAGTALLASRTALGAATDAVLASLGNTNPRGKWRFRNLDRFGQQELKDRYLSLETDPATDDDALLARARERVLFSQDLLIDAQSNVFLAEGAKP